MDLNVLFAAQVEKLEECYLELGYAPDRLQIALQAAIDNEVKRSVQEINDAKEQIEGLTQRCDAYRLILDEPKSNSESLSWSSAPSNLFTTIKELQLELDRLLTIYASRKAQAEKLVARIEEYRPILGDQVAVVDLNFKGPDASAVLPLPRPSELHAILSSCAEEVRKRNTELEENLSSIVQLWSDLWHLPDDEDEFDAMILHHLNLRPLLADAGQGKLEFAGLFEEMNAEKSGMDATPTRKSGSERELGTQVARVQRKNAMSPTVDNLAKASVKVQELDAERERRFELIQQLFDDLSLLWKRFDVGDDAVDDFVQENTGCNLAVIQAYERELKQMRDLKQEHMTLFISKVREDVASLWDQLLMTEDERRDSLPEFFQDLLDGEEGGGVEPSDELLALHEQKVKELTAELAVKVRPLELVRQYKKLLEEAHELETSAKDTSRLTGRGTGQKRDPGRLLREEKMRKRIKVLKPKIEGELMKTIPAWEEESGRPFCINGERFLDTVDMELTSPKKRMRTLSSNISIAATPQTQTKRSRAESAQVTSSSVRKIMPTPHSFSTSGARQMPTSVKSSHIARPGLPGLPTPSIRAPLSALGNGALQNIDTNRMASHSSTASISSVKTDRTTIIHKPLTKLKRRGPSLLVEQSMRNSGLTKSDFAKPCSTGVGASVRPVGFYSPSKEAAANESVDGPNWAVFDENDESNLLS